MVNQENKLDISKTLIIFDCDGVLVDSEVIACSLRVKQLKDLGVPITLPEFVNKYVGGTPNSSAASLEQDYDIKLPENYYSLHKRRLKQAFSKNLQPVDGIIEFIQHAPNRCVASNGSLEKIKLSLETTGLDKYFPPECIFSADMVESPKPSPDLFLYVCQKMGFSPQEAIVIEDSLSGINAAITAGIPVVALTAASHFKIEGKQSDLTSQNGIQVCETTSQLKKYIFAS